MRLFRRFSIGLTLGCFSLAFASQSALAQAAGAETAQPEVVLSKLVGPTYPPLARQARIQGDVKVNVHVRADGSVASVELLSGHPMLAPAAVESATKSVYECRGCAKEASYELTYTFGSADDSSEYDKVEERPARSAKCFYLWKCGILLVHTYDCEHLRPPQISQSPGHVTILAFSPCLETESSASASR